MLFKKTISVLMALFLLVSSGGWSLNIHYCGGEIESISAFERNAVSCCDHHVERDKCCSIFDDEEDESCCSDDIIQMELEDIVVEFFKSLSSVQAILPNFSHSDFSLETSCDIAEHLLFYFYSNAPPLYLLHSQLIFYA